MRRVKRIALICETCGKSFERRHSKIKSDKYYCSNECKYKRIQHVKPRGEGAWNWKGGRTLNSNGYVMIRNKNHPRAYSDGYVLEHIIVAEKMLGRPLLPGECVHHINHIKTDNRQENLMVYASASDHMKMEKHHIKGSRNDCSICGGKYHAKGLCRKHYFQNWYRIHPEKRKA